MTQQFIMLGDTAGILSNWASHVARLPGATGSPNNTIIHQHIMHVVHKVNKTVFMSVYENLNNIHVK